MLHFPINSHIHTHTHVYIHKLCIYLHYQQDCSAYLFMDLRLYVCGFLKLLFTVAIFRVLYFDIIFVEEKEKNCKRNV